MSAAPRSHRVSVGHLAAFVHRHGDLGGDARPRVRPLEGLRRAQRHQAAGGARYASEVRLAGVWESAGVRIEIEGRADGVLTTDEGVRIDELKTCRGDAQAARERAGRMHDAQVMLYGALWLQARAGQAAQAAQASAPRLSLAVIYLDADDDSMTQFEVAASPESLEAFLDDTCSRYARWLAAEARRLQVRDASLLDLAFPLDGFRPGQRDLARAVWQTLSAGGVLIAEAPTGIGKTLGVVYAAMRHLPTLAAERVLYLTARGSGRRLALSAAATLQTAGATLRVTELLARERICPVPGTPCNATACERARGHFDRRPAALADLLGHENPAASGLIDAACVTAVADRHRVCPAALQHDAARFSDLVIGDYNYGFDPFARQRALLDPEDGGAAVLVDEAHNLVDRAREMHSGALELSRLAILAREARRLGCDWQRLLSALVRALGKLDEAGGVDALLPVVARIDRLAAALSAWLAAAPAGPPTLRFQQLLGDLIRFADLIAAATGPDRDAWQLIRSHDADGARIALRNLCPAPRTGPDAARFAGLVLFSATLQPAAVHRDQLGLAATTRALTVPCPFPAERRLVLQVAGLDLRARARAGSLAGVVAVVEDLVRARAGHYLVFAPSFDFLAVLADGVAAALPHAAVIRQTRAMSEADRAAFVQAFRTPDGDTRIGFAVSGGVFGEGIDLPGEQLVGVVVAGLPLPAPDVERRALQGYHGAVGYEVAFRVPAMTRLLQAAGRLIRDAQDLGIICLVDDRLARREYARMLPEAWQARSVAPEAVGTAAAEFWSTFEGGATASNPLMPRPLTAGAD